MEESCIEHAESTFRARGRVDTEPSIVQMVQQGDPVDHWYYRSREHIDQPYQSRDLMLQAFVGPAKDANPTIYGEGTFVVDIIETEWMRKKYCK